MTNAQEIIKSLKQILSNRNLFIESDDMPLSRYIYDNEVFSCIIEDIENRFDIALPCEIVLLHDLGTFNSLLNHVITGIVFRKAIDDSDHKNTCV